ncbi:MAG: hypothetical protein LBB05_00495, partial [Puniceicoccales bacterium]|nr:hypothetical protein [Puniceicoccales bacterium]
RIILRIGIMKNNSKIALDRMTNRFKARWHRVGAGDMFKPQAVLYKVFRTFVNVLFCLLIRFGLFLKSEL